MMPGFSKPLIRELKSRARDQARWLIRDHGPEAETVIEAKLRRKNLRAEDRKRYQLTKRELKRLRLAAGRRPSTAVMIWRPKASFLSSVAALFGSGRRRS